MTRPAAEERQECPTCGAPLVYCGGEWRPPPLQTLTAEQLQHHHKPITDEQIAAALEQGRKDRDALEAATPSLPGRFRGALTPDAIRAAIVERDRQWREAVKDQLLDCEACGHMFDIPGSRFASDGEPGACAKCDPLRDLLSEAARRAPTERPE